MPVSYTHLIGTQVELSNTYHLHVRPGDQIIKQIGLDLHALLRAHENLVSVDMRAESYALFLDFAQPRQRKYLKSTGDVYKRQ